MEAIFALVLFWMRPRGPAYNLAFKFSSTMVLNTSMATVITFYFNYTSCFFAAKCIWLPLTGFTIGYYKNYLCRDILPFIIGISPENTDPEKGASTSRPPTTSPIYFSDFFREIIRNSFSGKIRNFFPGKKSGIFSGKIKNFFSGKNRKLFFPKNRELFS
jgi:hypothetical protein